MEKNINAQHLDMKATLREIFLLLLFICLRHTTIHSYWNPAFNVQWKLKQLFDAWKTSPLASQVGWKYHVVNDEGNITLN